MKKYFFALVILFVLLLSACIINAKDEMIGKVEQKVFDKASNDGKARAIVILKDNNKLDRDKAIRSISKEIGEEKINHKFESANAFSASLSLKDINELEKDGNIEKIAYDMPLKIMLQDSAPLINATKSWAVQISGINLTGKGETICIIDTGVDYTHPDLGNCTPIQLALNGTAENLTIPVESAHNYTDDFNYTWTINKTGYLQIAVHFNNISLEYPGQGGFDSFDRIIVYNAQMREIARYHGINGVITNLWTPYSEGDSIYIRLISDASVNAYGFYIDQIRNGTTNTSYDWSNCTKVVGGWDFVNNDGNPADDNGHGTHVAGIAAANGVAKGIAPEAKIIAAKAMDSGGSGWTSDVVAGIEWCVNRSEEFNISVISMSLGGADKYTNYCDSSDTLTSAAINSAVAKGVSVVVAAGNNGWTDGISAPACMQNAIPAGGTDKSDAITFNRNFMVQLLAPGVSINSTKKDGGHYSDSGTSMATPHVAGAFAVINQLLGLRNQAKTPQEIEAGFNQTGKSMYDSASGLTFSRIDVYNAILYFDIYPPAITVNSPKNNSWSNGQFNASLSENGSCMYSMNNGITNISMNSSDNRNFYSTNSTLIQDAAYNITFYCNDSAGNANNSGRINFRADMIPPNVSLISPDNGYSATGTQTINFTYNVSDNLNVTRCDLIINNAFIASNSSAISQTNNISYSVSAGTYSWSINCTDEAGNTGNSSSRSMTINQAESSNTPSGGGGGGGVSVTTYSATREQLAEGYNKELKKDEKIRFEIESSNVSYENHEIKLENVGSNFANITIRSSILNLILQVGEERKFNLTSANYYDLYIMLENIASNKANLTIKSIKEEITKEKEEITGIWNKTEEKNETEKSINAKTIDEKAVNNDNKKNTAYAIYAVVILTIFVIIACIRRKNRKIKKKFKSR